MGTTPNTAPLADRLHALADAVDSLLRRPTAARGDALASIRSRVGASLAAARDAYSRTPEALGAAESTDTVQSPPGNALAIAALAGAAILLIASAIRED